MRLGKLKSEKPAGMNEVTGELVKVGGDMVVDWIWRLCSMSFEIDVVPEDWRSPVMILLYEGKRERRECKNYRDISLLSMVQKVYSEILVD